MARDRLARAMAETLINKVVIDIKSDPERGLRNIIDLALIVPRGKFSRNLFSIVQRILSDEDSAYYTLVKSVASDVDTEILKKFTFNIGYNSCAYGARLIKSNKKTMGLTAPWSIAINSAASENDADTIKKLISEGKDLGVYLYLIYGENCINNYMREIYRENEDCAFILFMDTNDLSDISKVEGINNLLISITNSDSKSLIEAADILHRYSKFFAFHIFYDDENIDRLLTPQELAAAEDFTNSFVFYIPKDGCSKEACLKMKSYLRNLRDTQKYAYIPIDLRGDLPEIDNTICEDSYSICFRKDGKVSTSKGDISSKKYDISQCSLAEIIKDLHSTLK